MTEAIDREALEWFVRMRDGQVSAADRRAFQAWLDRDAAHVAALARAEALWQRLDVVKPELQRMRRAQGAVTRRATMLGGLALMAGGASMFAANRPDLFADYTSDIGQRRRVTLADGSMVELGSYSALSVDMTATSRGVSLYRGQAFFDIVADVARPFRLDVAGGVTTTTGGRLDLRYVDRQVTVTVANGAADVRAAQQAALPVGQGWQVDYGDWRGIAGPVKADLAITDAWRRGRIIFQDAPLRRVLAELERYRRGRIMLLDRAIGEMPVTAVFDTAQASHALQTIADTLPLRVISATSLVTFVYAA